MGEKFLDILTEQELALYFDHTQLRANAAREDFVRLCEESRQYQFRMVAINPAPVALCRQLLEGTQVHVGAAISFPLGQETIDTKLFSIEDAMNKGADEIDYVINLTQLKDKNYQYIEMEMEKIVKLCRDRKVISKVIFENCYLTQDEILLMSKIASEKEPDFIKTSTGFGTGGATAEDVAMMKKAVGVNVKVKAAGGIRTLDRAIDMIHAGAERLGSTASVKIIQELVERKKSDLS